MIMQADGSASTPFQPGNTVQLLIRCTESCYQIIVNGSDLCGFRHRRTRPQDVTHLAIYGEVEPQSIVYKSKSLIIRPPDMYWRLLGAGHLLQVESSLSATWGLGYDSTAWVYTGGWGGAHFKDASEQSAVGIHPMEDTKYFYVYENQVWPFFLFPYLSNTWPLIG